MENRTIQLEIPQMEIEIEHKKTEILKIRDKIANFKAIDDKIRIGKEKL